MSRGRDGVGGVACEEVVVTIEDAVGHSATGGDRESVLVTREGFAV